MDSMTAKTLFERATPTSRRTGIIRDSEGEYVDYWQGRDLEDTGRLLAHMEAGRLVEVAAYTPDLAEYVGS